MTTQPMTPTTETPESRHMPGEWQQRAERDGRTTVHYVKIGTGNCYLTRGVGQTEAEVIANARLIALTPELLESVKELVRLIESEDLNGAAINCLPEIQKARALLARAGGTKE